MASDEVTEREGLQYRIRLTVQFEFGSACDLVDKFVENGKLDQETADNIKRQIRMRGNNIINVVGNHLGYYLISRNHRKDEIDITQVVARAAEG